MTITAEAIALNDANMQPEALPQAPVKRIYYLDNLRACLTMLVIIHHAAAVYGAPGGFSYMVREDYGIITQMFLTMFASVNMAFFMSLFFFISAYFTVPGVDKKGGFGYMRRRLMRLGIPFLVYYFILSPLVYFMTNTFKGRTDAGIIEYISTNYTALLHTGPVWFLETLLIFESIYLAYRFVSKRLGIEKKVFPMPGNVQILLFILGVGIFAFIWRCYFPTSRSYFFLTLGNFPLYVCMFPFGMIAYRSGWLEQLTKKQANLWFGVSIAAIISVPVILSLANLENATHVSAFMGGYSWQSFAYATWEPFICVGISMKLLQLYRDRANFQTPLTRELTRSAFTAYIFQHFYITLVAHPFSFVDIPVLLEIVVLWGPLLVLSFTLSGLIRRLPLARRIL